MVDGATLKLANGVDDLANAFYVRTQFPVKQEKQQRKKRNDYEISQSALCLEERPRSGIVVSALALGGGVG